MEAGFIAFHAFHAFHTLAFPWPAFRGRIKSKLPTTPFSRKFDTHHACRCLLGSRILVQKLPKRRLLDSIAPCRVTRQRSVSRMCN